jgi:hypothetical protein
MTDGVTDRYVAMAISEDIRWVGMDYYSVTVNLKLNDICTCTFVCQSCLRVKWHKTLIIKWWMMV